MNRTMRLKIVGLVFLPFLLATFLLHWMTRLNIVERDPIPFNGRDLKIVYQADAETMTVSKAERASDYRIEGTLAADMTVDQEGRTTAADGKAAYTPFWIPFINPILTPDTRNPEYAMADPAGILGAPNTTYLARQEDAFILWDDIVQSQASYHYGIFDDKGRRAATAVYDATCGLLFRLEVKQPDKPDLRLLSTNFPISRNRIFLSWSNIVLAGLLVYWLFRRARRMGGYEIDTHAARLVLLGVCCLATDTLMDLWYPYLFGSAFPFIWHGVLILAIFYYSPVAALPAAAEIVMAAGLWMYIHHTAPTFAFIPGLTVSFLMAIRGSARRLSDSPLP